jgi:hypothetical protein
MKTMRSAIRHTALFLALLLIACDERKPLELDNEASKIEVAFLWTGDTSAVEESSVDSTGLNVREEGEYSATFLISKVKTDIGAQRSSFSFSRALVKDKQKPIELFGKVVGYEGLDVGTVRLNGVEIPKVGRALKAKGNPPPHVTAGINYKSKNVSVSPNTPATFQGTGNILAGIGPFAFTGVRMPAELTVTQPSAQSLIVQDEDLSVRWNGAIVGSLQLVVSGYTLGEIDRPILVLRVQDPARSFRIPSTILGLLPASQYEQFMFSFISLNRQEETLTGYSNKALLQSASIHNIVLPVRAARSE